MRKREKPMIQPGNGGKGSDQRQEAARHLGRNLGTIIDDANVWFNAQDKEGKVLIWNEAAEKISGYSREEVMALGPTWERLIYPDERYRREVLKRESALLKAGTDATSMETRIRCKDGLTKTISWRSRSLRDEKGNPIGSFALVLDITEQKQAEEALRRRAIQLQTIGEVSRKISSILNLDELLSYVVGAIQKNFRYYHVDIFWVDQDYAVFKTSSNPAVGRLWKEQNLRYKVGQEGLIGWVAKNGQTILANDISQESRYLSDESLPKTQAELTVPIRMDERIIGVLDVQSNVLNAFNKDDIFVLETLASQLAIAIENAGLYAKAKKRAERMAILNRIGLLTASTLDLNEVLNLIHEQTSQLMTPDTFYIALYDEQKEQMSFEIFVEKGESFGKFSRKLGEMGLTGWIIRSKKPLLIRNLAEERPPVEPRVLGEPPSRLSYLGVPIMCREKVTGVISVQSFQPYTFDEEDRGFLTAIANQACIAIENARLYKEAQQEIAARRHIEGALRESEERFRTLFDNLAIGIYRTSLDGTIFMANPALVRMLGYASFEELAERNLEEVGFEPEYPRELFKQRIEKEGQIVGLESAWVRRDGTTLFVRESARAVRDKNGNTLYYEGTVEDITARKQVENALQESRNELERRVVKRTAELKNVNSELQREVAERKQAEDQLRTLNARHKRAVTIVSHELSTPLTSIKGYADLLSTGHFGSISAKQQEILAGITRNSQRLATLVDAFLNLERIEAGTLRLNRSRFRLEDLLADIEEMYQLTAQKNGLRLQADLESEMRVYADRTELAQVFSNLVSNALKFSDTGTVCITAKRCQGQAVVKVVDQGQGISEQDLPYIFDEFYQAQDTSFGKPPQGIGLGLSIAKKIVTAHQGTIQVKSRVGKGSTFTVALPLAEERRKRREDR